MYVNIIVINKLYIYIYVMCAKNEHLVYFLILKILIKTQFHILTRILTRILIYYVIYLKCN